MQVKKKICAGFDSIEHEAYIYKNIGGKKYCKSCAMKLQKPKSINKVSKKQVFKIKLKKKLISKDHIFYMDIWEVQRKCFGINFCEICKTRLFESSSMNFHHILEKRNYPEYRHSTENIIILCSTCHNNYETNPKNVPLLCIIREHCLREQYLIKQKRT